LVVIPVYVTYQRLNLKNNLFTLALVDVAFVLPICIWILKNVFDSIPREIRDAALVDGCTRLGWSPWALSRFSMPGTNICSR
jgi:multiple sugar transport system permease protein